MKLFALQAIFIASLGGILYGYDLGAVSGALPPLSAEFDLDDVQRESFVSILYWGGGVGAALGGSLCDRFGRRTAILLTDLTFLIAALALRYAPSYNVVLVGRFTVGCAVAISGVADIAYLTEIAPRSGEGRGSIVSVNEACISLGFLIAYGASYLVANAYSEGTEGWRILFGGSGVVAVLQFFGMLYMPESPVWLEKKGRADEARAVWLKIEGGPGGSIEGEETATRGDSSDVAAGGGEGSDDGRSETPPPQRPKTYGGIGESVDMRQRSPGGVEIALASEEAMVHPTAVVATAAVDAPRKKTRYCVSHLRSACRLTWLRQIRLRYREFVDDVLYPYRRQCVVSVFLAAGQQFCGHPNVLNFAPEIFAQIHDRRDGGDYDASPSKLSPETMTVLIGVAKFVMTLLVIWKVERLGRRILLLSGMALIAVSLLMLWIAFATDPGGGSNGPSTMDRLAVVGVYGVAVGYAASYGPLTWLLTSELFPADVRGRALGAATVVTYLSAGIVSRTFLSVRDEYGPSAPFAAYFSFTAISLVLAFVAVPETGEKSVEEINREMDAMWFWRSGRRRGDGRGRIEGAGGESRGLNGSGETGPLVKR